MAKHGWLSGYPVEQANIGLFFENLTRNIYLLSEIFGFIEILQTLKRENHIFYI